MWIYCVFCFSPFCVRLRFGWDGLSRSFNVLYLHITSLHQWNVGKRIEKRHKENTNANKIMAEDFLFYKSSVSVCAHVQCSFFLPNAICYFNIFRFFFYSFCLVSFAFRFGLPISLPFGKNEDDIKEKKRIHSTLNRSPFSFLHTFSGIHTAPSTNSVVSCCLQHIKFYGFSFFFIPAFPLPESLSIHLYFDMFGYVCTTIAGCIFRLLWLCTLFKI